MRTRLSDTCDTLTYQSNLLAHCVQLTQAINAEAAKEGDEGDEGHEDEATRRARPAHSYDPRYSYITGTCTHRTPGAKLQ